MGRTACTEPQCLYSGALYLYLLISYCLRTVTVFVIFSMIKKIGLSVDDLCDNNVYENKECYALEKLVVVALFLYRFWRRAVSWIRERCRVSNKLSNPPDCSQRSM